MSVESDPMTELSKLLSKFPTRGHPVGFLSHILAYFYYNFGEEFSEQDIINYKGIFMVYCFAVLQKNFTDTRYNWGKDKNKIGYTVESDLKFGATVEQSTGYDAYIRMNEGLFFSLFDLSLRAVCDSDFFNSHISERKSHDTGWLGCRTLEFSTVERVNPKRRFFDYNTTPEVKNNYLRNQIGIFVKKFPIDYNRVILALYLFRTALKFVFLHEEEHYRLGHFDLIKKRQTLYRQQSFHIDGDQSHMISSALGNDLFQAIEYQADASAAKVIFESIIHESSDDQISFLPQYCHDVTSWKVQFGLSAIGIALVAINEGRIMNGDAGLYPSINVRFCGVMQAISKLILSNADGASYKFSNIDGSLNLKDIAKILVQCGRSCEDIVSVISVLRDDDSEDGLDFDPFFADEPGEFYKNNGPFIQGSLYFIEGMNLNFKSEETKSIFSKFIRQYFAVNPKNFNPKLVRDISIRSREVINKYKNLYDIENKILRPRLKSASDLIMPKI